MGWRGTGRRGEMAGMLVMQGVRRQGRRGDVRVSGPQGVGKLRGVSGVFACDFALACCSISSTPTLPPLVTLSPVPRRPLPCAESCLHHGLSQPNHTHLPLTPGRTSIQRGPMLSGTMNRDGEKVAEAPGEEQKTAFGNGIPLPLPHPPRLHLHFLHRYRTPCSGGRL